MNNLENNKVYTQKKLLELADESLLKEYGITTETFEIASRYTGLRKQLNEKDTTETIKKNKKNKHSDLQMYLDLSKLSDKSPYWVRYFYYESNNKGYLIAVDFNSPDVQKKLVKRGKDMYIQFRIGCQLVYISKTYNVEVEIKKPILR